MFVCMSLLYLLLLHFSGVINSSKNNDNDNSNNNNNTFCAYGPYCSCVYVAVVINVLGRDGEGRLLPAGGCG